MFLNLFQKKEKEDEYSRYPTDLKNYCEYRDKYQELYLTIGNYTEIINNLYSDYINYKNQNTFNELLTYCTKYIELLPELEKAKKEDTKINGTQYTSNYCLPYHKLAMAYEKAGCYNSAINVCNEAIKRGYSDGTKGGFKERINRLKKKQEKL